MPVLTAGLLTGCNHGALQTGITGTPDPFGSVRTSAVCQVSPPKAGPTGDLVSSMTVRSDDGRCLLSVAAPDGGHYASFGVSPAPEHGKAFLYTLDGRVQISYTPSLGYAGTDTFTAILIRGPGQKRDRVTVTATVDATGVVLPKPAVSEPPKAEKTTKKAPVRRRRK
nr:Ig-like domain-containing protein [Acetobacter musti]